MDRLQVEYLPISKLKPYKRNARTHNAEDVEAIAQSIEDFKFSDPIGVWGPENLIVEGHGRLLAAKKLGLKEVPVIHLDYLTEEEQRAYRLAHNKTAELSFWDNAAVKAELKTIGTINMGKFGFSLPDLFNQAEDAEGEGEAGEHAGLGPDDDGYYGDERERTYDAYNLHDYDPERVTGPYDLPVLKKCDYVPENLIGFNYMLSTVDRDAGIHFFIDDYQFERVWGSPHQYMEKLGEFPCVLTPDFSLYMDMPLAMKIWNTYRSRLIGQIMFDEGIQVIPTLQWAGPETFDFVFDGIEGGGTVAVSTVGVMKDKEAKKIWRAGMEKALERIHPKTVVCYGAKIDFDFGNIDTVTIKAREFV